MNREQGIIRQFVEERNISKEIVHAVGYGSAIIPQKGYTENKLPALDSMFVVKDSVRFHEINMKEFPEDYSILLKTFGPRFFDILQNTGGAISYNLLNNYDGRRLKYGVISEKNFLSGNKNWDRGSYVGFRFQKPHDTLISGPDHIQDSITENLSYAFRTAILLLSKDEVTYRELFEKITSLSYMGDPRPEHPEKIQNIVSRNMERFHDLYHSILEDKKHFDDKDHHMLTISEEKRETMKMDLPSEVQRRLSSIELLFSSQEFYQKALENAVKSIVRWPATIQIIKGAVTSNPTASIPYALEKIRKSFSII